MVLRVLRPSNISRETNPLKKVEVNFASLRETKVHEYVVRFAFGGICTVFAGFMAKRYGPAVGGLFLAFPAIFPASATMIESHEKRRKAELGMNGTLRGRMAASIDASGAALGCVGLAGFAMVLWIGLPAHNSLTIVVLATVTWAILAYTLWAFRKG
jgi:hypothetical protein